MKFKNSDCIGQYSNSAQSPNHGFSLLMAAMDVENVKNCHSLGGGSFGARNSALENGIRGAMDPMSHCISSILGVDHLLSPKPSASDDFCVKRRQSFGGKFDIFTRHDCSRASSTLANQQIFSTSLADCPQCPPPNRWAACDPPISHSMQAALPILGGLLSPSSFMHIPMSLPQYYSNNGCIAKFSNRVAHVADPPGQAAPPDFKEHKALRFSPDSTHLAEIIPNKKVAVKNFSLPPGTKKVPSMKKPAAESTPKNHGSTNKQYLRYKLLERKNRLDCASGAQRKIKAVHQNTAPAPNKTIFPSDAHDRATCRQQFCSSPHASTHLPASSSRCQSNDSIILKENIRNLADRTSTAPHNLASQLDQSSTSTPLSPLSKASSQGHDAPCNEPPRNFVKSKDCNATMDKFVVHTAPPPLLQQRPSANYRRHSSTDQGSSSGEDALYGGSPLFFMGPNQSTGGVFTLDGHSTASYFFGTYGNPADPSATLALPGLGKNAALHHYQHHQETSSGGSTSSDADRYVERRRRNNEAAKRCRANRRALFDLRLQRAQELEKENVDLKGVIGRLLREVGELRSMLQVKSSRGVAPGALEPSTEILSQQRRSVGKRARRAEIDEKPLDFSNKKMQLR